MNITATTSSPFSSLSLRTAKSLSSEAVDAFASEIARRSTPASQTKTDDTVSTASTAETGSASTGASGGKSTDKLQQALENAVNYVQDNYGDTAARAVMSMVVARTGSGQISENSLSNGLVDGLKFIDQTFGTKEGDKAISFFNGELNQAVNTYFDNGQNEEFYAKTLSGAQAELGQATAAAAADLQESFSSGDKATSLLDAMLQSIQDKQDDKQSGTSSSDTSSGDPAVADRITRSAGSSKLAGYAQGSISTGLVLNTSV